MKRAAEIAGILALVVAALQLVHDTLGVGVAPVTATRDVYRSVTGDVAAEPSDGLNDAAQILDDSVEDLKEELLDSTPPTSPINLRIAKQEGCVVTLEWDASTDDEELGAYRIYEGSSFDGMVQEDFTQFEVRLFAGDTQTYTVIAVDGSGNESERSNEVTASCS